MPTIHVKNTSNHDQTFEVHGFNNDKNITVKPHNTVNVTSPDHLARNGAIIALHDGHEGEQAEIGFNGYADCEYYDISVIVGAGGNLTIEQVGNPKTRKGDPTFMQDLRRAWSKADAATKSACARSVHLNAKGEVVRIDAPKNNQALEKFVRTFADCKLYIGVGAWGGSAGNPCDNKQSSGTKGGNKDLQLVYSDFTSAPGVHTAAHFASPEAAQALITASSASAAAAADAEEAEAGTSALVDAAIHPQQAIPNGVSRIAAQGDADHGGPGVILSNRTNQDLNLFFFNNYWNGNGTAGANFDHPDKSVHLAPHATAFSSLATSFKGRVQRGRLIPATWVEFQIAASDGTGAHGDISLEQGCDGPAMIHSTDGTKRSNGFAHDILKGAPAAAVVKRSDGVKVLASTVGNWMGGPNQAAIAYERKVVGQKHAYITGGTGTDDVGSRNKRLMIEFF